MPVEINEKRVLSLEFNNAGSRQTVKESKLSVKKTAAFPSKEMVDGWAVSSRLASAQKFPVLVTQCFGNVYKISASLERCAHILYCNCLISDKTFIQHLWKPI